MAKSGYPCASFSPSFDGFWCSDCLDKAVIPLPPSPSQLTERLREEAVRSARQSPPPETLTVLPFSLQFVWHVDGNNFCAKRWTGKRVFWNIFDEWKKCGFKSRFRILNPSEFDCRRTIICGDSSSSKTLLATLLWRGPDYKKKIRIPWLADNYDLHRHALIYDSQGKSLSQKKMCCMLGFF